MPLTEKQISTFFNHDNLKEFLDELVEMGYLTLEYPRKKQNGRRVPDETKPKGYNIVAGKLSFEFTKILDPADLAPTLVAMDVSAFRRLLTEMAYAGFQSEKGNAYVDSRKIMIFHS